jgi:hypothetical protein
LRDEQEVVSRLFTLGDPKSVKRQCKARRTASGEGFEELGRQGVKVIDELQRQPLVLLWQRYERTVDVCR